MENFVSLGSDNHSGIHPRILEAIIRANSGSAQAYGQDPWTHRATEKIKRELDAHSVHFVFNGTAANVLGLASEIRSWNGVICADSAHLNTDECGAPEKFLGAKLLTAASVNGKLTPETIKPLLSLDKDVHHNQPRVLSITQTTEYGTVYQIEEIKELSRMAHGAGLKVHMDGARIYNAAAALGVSLKEITKDCGIDLLSLGGTKNGLMVGEAVVSFNETFEGLPLLRKQSMQLASKMRFVAAQFEELFTGELWRECAEQANSMARFLAQELENIEGIDVVCPVEANAVFVRMDPARAEALKKKVFFHTWDPSSHVYRLMTAFDSTREKMEYFLNALRG